MKENQEFLQQILSAQQDPQAADQLIRAYIPFIKSEAAKTIKRIPREDEDELSVAMLAFYEALQSYEPRRGSFLKLAATAIRSRLIDHHRQERRHHGLVSYHQPREDSESELLNALADDRDHMEGIILREAARKEIEDFSLELLDFGLDLSDVADNCPRQERTRRICMKVLAYARSRNDLLEQMVRTRKLPLAQLCEATGADRKTLERHRRYMMALLLAYTNGFEIIRGHLYQMDRKEESV